MEHAPALHEHGIFIAFLILGMICLLVALARFVRHQPREWVRVTVCTYFFLLLFFFLRALLTDDGYGWAYMPVFVATAPWAFLFNSLPDWFMAAFAGSLVGNFLFFVGLCGGLNAGIVLLLSYLTVKRRSQAMPSVTDS